MRKKLSVGLISLLIGFPLFADNSDGNPFKKFGYHVEVGTFGDGEEFHDGKEVVEIGLVLYNTKTNKVVGFAGEKDVRIELPKDIISTSIDPHCERYYSISPYAYCFNNPVRFIDPDGRDVIAHDEESRRNIINTLTEDEAKYVKFKKDGTLNTRKLNKSKSDSDNMTALKTLANSDVKYNFVVSNKDGEGKSFIMDKGDGNFYYGQTEFPNNEGAPQGKDGNVWIYTANFLSEGLQAENVAHEGYGHGFFYEKSRTDKSYDPFHRYENVPTMGWDKEFNVPDFIMNQVDSNTRLNQQIQKVTNQARMNYANRKKR